MFDTVKKLLKISCASLMMLAILSGCEDILEETPRGSLTPETFASADGLRNGLIAAYARFRPYYGYEAGAMMAVFSDEYMEGQQISDTPLAIYTTLNPSNGRITFAHNNAYPAINTCNGIIQIGPDATGLTTEELDQLIAEAKFLRGAWYFLLARQYGGATIDLGSGPYAFNTNPTNVLTRATEEEVMDGVIADLRAAATNLPDQRPDLTQRGRVWKASALHLLSKAYLFRGYRSYAGTNDYDSALYFANDLITNRGTYGVELESNYADIWDESNEWPSEVMWTIEWNLQQQFNPGIQSPGGFEDNINNFLFREFYVQDVPGMVRDVENGRPWIRFSPTPWMIDVAFADKVNDQRYNGSFQTVWYANDEASIPSWSQAEADAGYVDASQVGQPKFAVGDTAMWHAPLSFQNSFASDADRRAWVNSKGYVVYFPTANSPTALDELPRNQQNKHFPSLSKFNRVARPEGYEEDPNIASTRPFYVHRFAETYLVAAEAAIQLGRNSEAVDYINVIRNRAGALPISVADLTGAHGDEIDFILDERTRELAGEHFRWLDLKRTGRLLERVHYQGSSAAAQYNLQFNGGAPAAGYTPPAPQEFHLLRPIPQSEIDATVGGYPQNPGYN